MFDFLPTKIIPPALLGGIVVYGLICIVWLQPLVEARMAELVYIPQCEANLHRVEAQRREPVDRRKQELDFVLEMFKGTGLEQIPMVSQGLEVARRQIEATSPKRLRTSRIERNNVCACAVDQVFGDNHLKMTLSVASLRTHIPAFLKSMHRNVGSVAASRTCGGLARQKG